MLLLCWYLHIYLRPGNNSLVHWCCIQIFSDLRRLRLYSSIPEISSGLDHPIPLYHIFHKRLRYFMIHSPHVITAMGKLTHQSQNGLGHCPTPLNIQSTVGWCSKLSLTSSWSLSGKYRKPSSVKHHALINFIKKPFLGNTENPVPLLFSIIAYLA